MIDHFTTRFFDGKHIQALSATVTILSEGLRITYKADGMKYELFWPHSSLQLLERKYENKPGIIGTKMMLGARLVINDENAYQAILPLVSKRNVKLSHVHHPWRKTWLLIAIVLLLFVVPIWKFHAFSMWIANIIPYSWVFV